MVRAKLYVTQIIPGAVGVAVHFNAVYEGSMELQKISENAIFGEATPMGSALAYVAADANPFAIGTEYYFDLDDGDSYATNSILATFVRKSFQSAPPAERTPYTRDEFRFVAVGPVDASLQMHIANPAATAYLDAASELRLTVRPAVTGRRSDAEIALRQQQLEETGARPWGDEGTEHRASWHRQVAMLERKLAQAKGEV